MTNPRVLQLRGVFLNIDGGTIKVQGRTVNGTPHLVEIDCGDDIISLMCAVTKLSERVKVLVDNERHTHRWARSKLAAAWRELDAAVGEEKKP